MINVWTKQASRYCCFIKKKTNELAEEAVQIIYLSDQVGFGANIQVSIIDRNVAKETARNVSLCENCLTTCPRKAITTY